MSSPTAGPIGPGTLLAGRYRLEDLLVDSDGARFWRATDTVLARSVAVHAVPSSDQRAPGLLAAARVSATVNDSHLLRVLDCDDADGVCWVVNEWGEGLSLDRMLDRGPLAPSRAAWLAQEVAEAIAAGHAQGVAHGRLNPEAVLVTHSGAVKLIGYVVDAALHHPRPPSPVYGELDAREADVIDLAGVLYAALTGRWPGVSESAVPAAPLEGRRPLRPRQVRAGVPRALDAICERVLQREGSRHELPIETAAEVAAALADVTGESTRSSAGVSLASVHDEPTSVLSRAALAEETARRSAPEPDAGSDTGSDTGPDTSPDATVDTDTDTDDDIEPATVVAETAQAERGPTTGPTTGELEATQATPVVPPARPEPVPAPPPFEDSPERPLFATTERRVPAGARAAAATTTRETPRPAPPPQQPSRADTAGGGSDPAFWPFEGDEQREPGGNGHEGRGWLRTALVVGLLLATVVAMVAAFSLGRGDGLPILGGFDDSPSEEPSSQPQALSVAAISDFDPQGDSEENPDQAANAIDGDPSTTWSTVTYYNRPDLGGLKDGVGLLLDLGEDQQVGQVTVRFATGPTSFEVYAAPEGTTQPPGDVSGLDLVGGRDDAPERATVELDPPPTTRFLVVWLTNLPSAPGGYRGEIAEINVRS